MNEFTQMLQSWQSFYATIASASATLAGLLFVSLSLNRSRLDEHAQQFARTTFANLVNVLLLALVFLIPHPEPTSLSLALLVFGCINVVVVVFDSVKVLRRPAFRAKAVVRLVALPLILAVANLLVAVLIYRRHPTAMYWPVGIVCFLLASASWNSWEILFRD